MQAEIVAPGARLYAHTDGSQGDWVVLCHAVATNHWLWEPQIEALSEHYRVLRYDTRGHGRSAIPHAPYSMNQLAGDIIACLDHFQIARAHLVGLSLGGVTAVAAALRAPSRVASLTVCDAKLSYSAEEGAALVAMGQAVRDRGIDAMADEILAATFTPASLAAKIPALEEARRMIRDTSSEGLVGCMNALAKAAVIDRLGEIKCPSLFLVGEGDTLSPPALMKAQAALVPGSTYVEIPGAGHLSNLERPAWFNVALLGFLATVTTP